MKLKEIKHQVYSSGYIECQEDCPFDRVCANHSSAGDFRSEDGASPALEIHAGKLMCASFYSNGDGDAYKEYPLTRMNGMLGMVCMKDVVETIHDYVI
jgi:hypothetical protein